MARLTARPDVSPTSGARHRVARRTTTRAAGGRPPYSSRARHHLALRPLVDVLRVVRDDERGWSPGCPAARRRSASRGGRSRERAARRASPGRCVAPADGVPWRGPGSSGSRRPACRGRSGTSPTSDGVVRRPLRQPRARPRAPGRRQPARPHARPDPRPLARGRRDLAQGRRRARGRRWQSGRCTPEQGARASTTSPSWPGAELIEPGPGRSTRAGRPGVRRRSGTSRCRCRPR